MILTAYDILEEIEKYTEFLQNIPILKSFLFDKIISIQDIYTKFCDIYFNQEFIINDKFQSKDKLNPYERKLFLHYPATIIDSGGIVTYKGYSLNKKV